MDGDDFRYGAKALVWTDMKTYQRGRGLREERRGDPLQTEGVVERGVVLCHPSAFSLWSPVVVKQRALPPPPPMGYQGSRVPLSKVGERGVGGLVWVSISPAPHQLRG